MAQAATREADRSDQETGARTAIYIYGIVPSDVETDDEVKGIGDPPGTIETVRHGDIAALVSEIPVDRPLGTPDDLTAHARILDASAGEVPVLPLRFGAVVTDRDAVTDELLADHHDEFAAALTELEGQAQYILKGRYDERAIISEIIEESSDAQRLRDAIRDKPEEATRNERLALGELIANTIAAKREADTGSAVRALEELGVDVVVREATHERDAVYLACLASVAEQRELEQVADDLATQWGERVNLKLLGPLAPYDFVHTTRPGG
ncbi:GvpL/GvpF family gas vesicle protein [Saccharomonospora azurea]|uniref:Gas vesicle synthesis protein GvpL/GvpF n=1 Tax=Saccharomonospora azurea NA-128 TaxID=882081 RepID=H8G5C1_9PSEU|nr:GvpL/GvpF family gas vesicle protein [Saccharomonospora azurea]EHY87175.1 Gas vesicle synthesis protein GvpL/GvpF [Saccharomonospora azurea NA-128]